MNLEIYLDSLFEQDRQRTYILAMRRFRVTIVAVEKTISITYSECVSVALVIQQCRVVLSSVTCVVLSYFSNPINVPIFGGGVMNIKCVLIFS